ncbi:calcium-binding protein [Pseudomonas entomophila]|uniref:calcium-binding protein n=1 Tax=Pseudomonas entomophila TaxID=312306 RepID=UPI0023D8F267|nr:hypothetical protein [Pseudomonas entomophila]
MAVIQGTAGADNLVGTAADDQIYGRAGNDVIDGGAGNDTLFGGDGADRLIGGAGIDTVSYADSTTGITLDFKTGAHTGFAAGDTFEGIEVFRGSAVGDRFVSDATAHTFEGGGGLDVLDYSGSVQAVNITIDNTGRGTGVGGDAQGDVFTGISTVIGSALNDTFTSSASLTLQGGAGNDVYYVYGGAAVYELAGGGYDEVRTNQTTYRLTNEVEALTFVGTGNFTGYGNASNNVITGGAGNDLLFGGAGGDRFVGGAGVDTVSYADSSTGITLDFKTGQHTGIAAGDTFEGIEVFRGTAVGDRFVSDATAHTFEGGGGLDVLDYSGSAQAVNITIDNLGRGTGVGGDAQGDVFTGFTTVMGSALNDTLTSTASLTLQGGAGDDVYYLYGGAAVYELAGGGYDEVRTNQTTYRLTNEVEALTFVGTGNFTGYGNASANVITGGAGNDLLFGGAGGDRFVGGAGVDIVSYADSSTGITLDFKTGQHTGIAAGDTFEGIEVFRGTAVGDRFVSDATAHTFEGGGGLDVLDYSGSAQAVNITIDNLGRGTGVGGDAQGDVFTGFSTVIGSALNDTLTSTASLTLQGGAGDDVYYVYGGAGVYELAGGGYDEVRTNQTTYRLTNEVEALTFVGTGNFTGYGNAGANVITGGAGNDLLFGGAGGDRFVGGAGVDTVSYADSSTGITLDFKTGQHTGIAAGDTFEGIEVFRGTAVGDRFVSDATAHTFEGGGGLDVLDYSGSAQAVNITIDNLGRGTGVGGDAQGDVFTGISTVIGSVFNDTLTSTASLTLQGGVGDDVYYVYGGAGVYELAGGGYDEVRTNQATYRLTNEVEALTFVGTGNFTGYGNASANVITGGAGNDLLLGGDGGDRFVGGAGVDTVSYADSSTGITLDFKSGVHTGFAAGDTFEGIEVFRGTAAADRFVSDATAHTFEGGGGLDVLDYSGSAQAITVTIDNANRGTGVGGDAQGDVFTGITTVMGSSQNDTFTSSTSSYLQGGAGDDVYILHGGASVLEQVGGGYDEVRTTLASYRLTNEVEALTYIGSGSFTGYGNASANVITGGVGNDLLFGGAGGDRFVGGAGVDTVSYADSGTGITLDFKTGQHTGIATGDTFEGIEVFRGSAAADTFISDATAHTFEGGGGADTLDYSGSGQAIAITVDNAGRGTGAGGDAAGDVFTGITTVGGSAFDDTFTTWAAATSLRGGEGNDIYYLNANATVIEAAGGGYDEVRTTLASYRLTNDVEALTYQGSGNFVGYGNASDNVITGGVGSDTLYGGAGADRFVGGAGNDTVSYGDAAGGVGVTLNFKTGVHGGIAAGDTFDSIEVFRGSTFADVFVSDGTAHLFEGGGGADTLDYSTSAQAITINVDNTGRGTGVGGDAQGNVFTGFATVTGTAFADTFTTASAATAFRGGAGDDVYFINGNATVFEEAGGGYDEVRTTLGSYRLTNEVEALTYLGTGNFVAYDSASDNIITGGVGNDTFYAGAGGADRFIGGAGLDTVSYGDSATGVTLNFKTGVHTGVAAGDTFDSIERFSGSGASDVFVVNDDANYIDGAGGVDLLTFASEGAGITLNLNATGADTYLNIESFEGSAFNDTLIGTSRDENFVGGAGADSINGGAGKDFAWYVNSSAGVSVNLATGVNTGGDAEGDVLVGIEGLAGSAYDDVLNGDVGANTIFGAEGNDVINGGAGNDFLYGDGIYYGDFGTFARTDTHLIAQADIINGGDGDDTIYGGGNDLGGIHHGDAGNDFILTARGTAYGDDGNDRLAGNGVGYKLFGGAGSDQLAMNAAGFGDGGEGGDTYTVDSWAQVSIQDTGSVGTDKVILKKFEAFSDVVLSRLGDDAYLFTKANWETGKVDSGVKLVDWYAGANTIESFQTNNGDTFTIT